MLAQRRAPAHGRFGEVLRLTEKEGRLYLDTNVYELLDGWTADLLDSDALGEAFEPEQRFENPDGSPILFDTDYLGNHRSLAAMPGPFADGEAAKSPIA